MLPFRTLFAWLALMVLIAGTGLRAQEADKKESGEKKAEESTEKTEKTAKKDAATAATHEVTRSLLKLEVELDGVFEALESAEISVRPDAWQILSVVEAAPHGGRVEAGEVLVKLDMKKIDIAIAEAEAAVRLAQLAARQSQEDLRLAKESYPLEMAKAERAAQIATEDLKRFNEIERPTSEKSAEFSLRMSAQSLEYQMEELRQLEKMYKADEITEETEEIILKRTRNDVERAKFSYEQAELRHEQALKIDLPRQQETNDRGAKLAQIEWERAQVTMPIAMRQKEIAAVKAEQELAKAADGLNQLKSDREKMNVTSPIRGVVYYGRATAGKWSGGAEARAALQSGGKLPPGGVVMTIVNPDALLVRAAVDEKQLGRLQTGMAARIAPAAQGDNPLSATLASISAIPVAIGGIDATATFKLGDKPDGVIAGMACKVKVTPVFKKDALAVPSSMVFEDDFDAGKRYVLVPGKDGEPQRRDVKIGQRTDDKTEIADGLKAGEKILTKKPD
ncbi:MAG: HlyD family efflux transporter periplasmic adaptor subunit [Pirellulales bacterium]